NQSGLVVRELLGATSVSRLRELLDAGAARMNPNGPWNELHESMVSALAEAYAKSGLTSILAEVFGEPPIAAVGRPVVKRESSALGSGLGWHQDAAFFGAGCGAVNVWTALTACGETCPSLSLIPQRVDRAIDLGYHLHRPSAATARYA